MSFALIALSLIRFQSLRRDAQPSQRLILLMLAADYSSLLRRMHFELISSNSC